MNRLERAARRRTRRVIGLNSGTSADGLDIVLLEVRGSGWSSSARALRFRTATYPESLSKSLHDLLRASARSARPPVPTICQADHQLGRFMGRAARTMRAWAEGRGLPCHLVGSHGQTIWHGPRLTPDLSGTLQIGHPATISLLSGLPVVADFRQADVAAGGEGAPLTPAFDYFLFRKGPRDTVCLNLGGIANLSAILARGGPSDVLGFDVGPCNLLLDGLAGLLSKLRYDKGGRTAGRGHPREDVVDEFLRDSYLRKPPPKSTGRERYDEGFVKEFASRAKRGRTRTPDILATACLFVARSIAMACRRFVLPRYAPERVVISGGGYHNGTLRGLLRTELRKLGLRAEPFREAGLGPDSKEAGLFAWLANESVCGEKAHLPQVTGAREARVLGVLHP